MKKLFEVVLSLFLLFNLQTKSVKAATNVVTTKTPETALYTVQGKQLKDVAAGPSSWIIKRKLNFHGEILEQIGPDEYLEFSGNQKKYQNPSQYLQIQNQQIKPLGQVGYNLTSGVEGIKVWLVRNYFNLSNKHTIYDATVMQDVKSFQIKNSLPATGIVDLATWKKMGFSTDQWYGIDSYVAPLRTNSESTRSDHIEAMIAESQQYLGQSWISGAASSPKYGVDCSGLVTQALYASGINPDPISAIQHAQAGHEWNSQLYWSDKRLANVNFDDRQRGDLIFFSDPLTGKIWHVGILLNKNLMIESWPPAVQVHSIYQGRGNIAGIKRVFD